MSKRVLALILLLLPSPHLVPPPAAWAQQPGRVYRIGQLLQCPINPETERIWNGYVQRLREHPLARFTHGRMFRVLRIPSP